MRTVNVAVAALVAAAALSGCGGSDGGDDGRSPPEVSGDQRGILGTVDALQAASRRDDADRICQEIFTASLARSIERASGHSCQAEVRETLTSPDAQFAVSRGIQVKGSRATATIRERNGNTSTMRFVKEGDRWRIEGVTPTKPS